MYSKIDVKDEPIRLTALKYENACAEYKTAPIKRSITKSLPFG